MSWCQICAKSEAMVKLSRNKQDIRHRLQDAANTALTELTCPTEPLYEKAIQGKLRIALKNWQHEGCSLPLILPAESKNQCPQSMCAVRDMTWQ